MFGTNIRIELKMLGFMHILEIFFHPQKFGTNFGRELKMLGFMHILEICFQPPNVWLKYQDISENVGFYAHPRNMFLPPNFRTNFGIEFKMLFFLHILEICFQPPNVWHK